jgi:hypothetical protein
VEVFHRETMLKGVEKMACFYLPHQNQTILASRGQEESIRRKSEHGNGSLMGVRNTPANVRMQRRDPHGPLRISVRGQAMREQ